jgi:4-diphosphocytidyl-2-C-methyl-D-erythritol kinase
MEKVLANAKLNLLLRIVDKLPNGYHQLEMINVPIELYDEIAIKPNKQFEQIFYPPLDCPYNRTTIFKAYDLLKNWFGDVNLKISVKKQIPQGSGMGGGSSDAAAFIKYVINKKNKSLDKKMINEIANKVGADVPFFLHNRPALVKGIGEEVFPFLKFPELNFLIIVPNFSVSTAWAYGQVKLPLTKNTLNSILNISEINEELLYNIMENDLEPIVEKEFPAIIELRKFMISLGAKKAMMTGSGSAVFGIFKDKESAEFASIKAKETFKSYKVFICKTLGA